MRCLLIQLLIGLFYQTVTVMCVYNSTCFTTCNFPGMICVHGRCKCDWQTGLFWTGARCLPCPSYWAMSETACIGYYAAAMSRANAQATCESMYGSLISLRDKTILSLIYQTTESMYGRRKRQPVLIDSTVGWTSAQAVQLTNLGLYTWNDRMVPLFDSTHHWWCKRSTPYLGYQHMRDEPTRITMNGESEKCVLYRRGHTGTPVVCLDDVFCSQSHPFICERSESTAQHFPASTIPGALINVPTFPGSSSATTRMTHTSSTTARDNQTTTARTDSNSANLGALAEPAPLKSNDKTKVIIIVVIVILLLVAAIVAGVFILKKYRQTTSRLSLAGSKKVVDQTSKPNTRPSLISGVSVGSDRPQENDTHSGPSSAAQSDLSLNNRISPTKFNIDLGKQQKQKPGGYSTQRFNEFE